MASAARMAPTVRFRSSSPSSRQLVELLVVFVVGVIDHVRFELGERVDELGRADVHTFDLRRLIVGLILLVRARITDLVTPSISFRALGVCVHHAGLLTVECRTRPLACRRQTDSSDDIVVG